MTSADSAHNEMNTIIHHGLRRDLERLERVLASPLPSVQREALCDHVAWMVDYLHHHHVGEDEGVWPRTLAKRPDLQPLVDEMEAEHAALAAASEGLRDAARAYRSDGSEAARSTMVSAVTQMQKAPLPHLDHEERVAMPLVVQTLDDEDWAYLAKNHFRKGVSLSSAAVLFMWLLDDLDQRRASIVKAELPTPLFWLLSRFYGPRYDREAAQRWGDLAGARA